MRKSKVKNALNIIATIVIIIAYAPAFLNYIKKANYIRAGLLIVLFLTLAMAYITEVDFYVSVAVLLACIHRGIMVISTHMTQNDYIFLGICLVIAIFYYLLNYVSREDVLKMHCEVDKISAFTDTYAKVVEECKRLQDEVYDLKSQLAEARQTTSTGNCDIDFFYGCKKKSDVKKRFLKLSQIYHPDNITGSDMMMQEINQQYHDYLNKY